MTDQGKALIVIPARGGSKRLPRKNVLPLAGKPLICWTIEAALDAELDAQVMVTSDDDEILDIARQYNGVIAYKRPAELAADTASTAEVVIDAVNFLRKTGRHPDIVVLLQPTSPLRSSDDIQTALTTFGDHSSDLTVVSVCEVDHPTAWTGIVGEDSRLEGLSLPLARSQDYKKEYRLNGAVYVTSTKSLLDKKTLFTEELRASIMPRERSIDIDEAIDFLICECLILNLMHITV